MKTKFSLLAALIVGLLSLSSFKVLDKKIKHEFNNKFITDTYVGTIPPQGLKLDSYDVYVDADNNIEYVYDEYNGIQYSATGTVHYTGTTPYASDCVIYNSDHSIRAQYNGQLFMPA